MALAFFCHVNKKNIEKLRQKGFVRGLEYHKMDSDFCHDCAASENLLKYHVNVSIDVNQKTCWS